METIKLGSRGESVKELQRRLNLAVDGIFGKLTDEAVKDFQTAHNLTADGIVGEKTWAALGVSGRVINSIIIHCSATPEGKDFTVADIDRWHRQRNFSEIGYHLVIYRDGSVHTGRDISKSGAHAVGYNANSIGICYIGGCAADGKTPKDTRTPQQKTALLKLVKELCKTYHIPANRVLGHRETGANKGCPSFAVEEIRKQL